MIPSFVLLYAPSKRLHTRQEISTLSIDGLDGLGRPADRDRMISDRTRGRKNHNCARCAEGKRVSLEIVAN